MRARLFSRHGKLGDLDFEIGEEATIGRGQANSIVLGAPAISNQHARIRLDRERDRYVLEDLRSLNGTELDGVPVAEPQPLDHLHVLTLAARYELIFQDRKLCARRLGEGEAVVASAPSAGSAPADTLVERAPVVLPEALDAAARPGTGTVVEAAPVVLPTALGGGEALAAGQAAETSGQEPQVLLELPDDFGTQPLPRVPGENVVGRTSEADISIPRTTVSRRHAVLRVDQGRVWVRDLESANRTYVEDVRLEPGSERELAPGTRLRFGDVEARIHFPGGEPEAKGGGTGATVDAEGRSGRTEDGDD